CARRGSYDGYCDYW
nr:immunoglobulin heavy chain junction region [Mus musculus]